MDSKLEAHIDDIFQDVPKTDKMVTMINRIKSKANTKYLQVKDQGYSRSMAFNEVDDWLMKAKVIVDEEVGKLTPAEIAALPKAKQGKHGAVVSSAAMEGEATPAVVVERDEDIVPEIDDQSAVPSYDTADVIGYEQEEAPVETMSFDTAPIEEAPVETPAKKEKNKKEKVKKEKPVKQPKEKVVKEKKGRKGRKTEVEEEEVEVPVKSSGKVGKIIGVLCLIGGAALIIVAVLFLLGIL